MNARQRQMREDLALRNAAKALFLADVEHVKQDLSAKGITDRVTDRLTEGAIDVFEEASEVADNNRGILVTLVLAIAVWFARNPILAALGFEEGHGDERHDGWRIEDID